MSAQLISLSGLPNQIIAVSLSLNDGIVSLNLKQYYNRIGGFWALDVYDQQGNLLVASLPLITGDWPAGNIMAPHDYLQIGQWFIINLTAAQTDFPTSQNIGSGFTLLIDDNIGSGVAPGYPTVPAVNGSGNWSSYNVAGLATVLG